MRIALLNTYDQTGGAALACFRLFRGLTNAGTDAVMMVREGTSSAQGVVTTVPRFGGRLLALMDGLPLHFYPYRQPHNFSPAWMPGNAVKEVIRRRPHVVHLHWIVQGFVQIEDISALNCPIVWTLHDSWPFTGGCHLPGSCRRYELACGSCPVLGSHNENDWSRRIWQRKQSSWKNLPMTVVVPSRWLANLVRSSSLFAGKRIEIIPNGIDTALFCPGDRQTARRALGLPEDRKLLLFGANHAFSDVNKGFDLLQSALRCLDEKQRQFVELVVFGDSSGMPLPDCGVPVKNLGAIADERLIVLLYRSADVFVAPSRMENFPNMVLEAMACGIPCVAFAIGGLPELVAHAKTGYLARPYEIKDLARGLASVLADEATRTAMGAQSREWVVSNAAIDRVVESYLNLYRELAVT